MNEITPEPRWERTWRSIRYNYLESASCIDYAEFWLLLPAVGLCKTRDSISNAKGHKFYAIFNTKIEVFLDTEMFRFNVQLFGFGFMIRRQWSY